MNSQAQAAPSGIEPLQSTPVEEYVLLYFLHKIGEWTPPEYPEGMSVELILECELIGKVLAKAFMNKVKVDIDIDWYSKRVGTALGKTEKETSLEDIYNTKEPPFDVYYKPTLFVDKHDRILTWYLPNLLTQKRQTSIWRTSFKLHNLLQASIKQGKDWRVHPDYFHRGVLGGCINLSPAWFQRARNVFRNAPEVSSLLKQHTEAQEWVTDMQPTFDLLNAVSRIMHGQQHAIARDAMNVLRNSPEILREPEAGRKVLGAWTSVFSAIAIVLNRRCPYHRDSQSSKEGLDLMVTVGEYSGALMKLQPLGVELLYDSGTVVALSGPLIRHAVSSRPGRLSLAFYMREAVHEKVGVRKTGFITTGGISAARMI